MESGLIKRQQAHPSFFRIDDDTKLSLDREEFAELIFQVLRTMSLEEVVSVFTNRFKECVEYAKLIKGGRACKNMSLLFNPHRLDTRVKQAKYSVFESFQERQFVNGISRLLLWRHNPSNLLDDIRLGYNNITLPDEFPPAAARNLCLKFKLGKSSRVLDPCAGWGGRMIGVSVVCDNYTGYEPCTKTHSGLLELHKFLCLMNPTFQAKVYKLPFEDSQLRKGYYDFALTSPPYYDTELYSDEETNSLNRYKTFEKWCDGFYFPLVEKTMNALKPGASFVLNIGAKKYPLPQVIEKQFSGKYQIKELKNTFIQNPKKGLRSSKEGIGERFFEVKHI